MNENATMGKLVGVAITLTVLIIMVGAMMVPIFGHYTSTEATHINEGMRASVYEPGTTHTIIMDSNGIKTDDGEYQPYPDTSRYGEGTLLFGMGAEYDEYRGNVVRFSGYNTTVYEYLYIAGNYSNRAIGNVSNNPVTVTIDENGTATLTPETGTARIVYNIVVYPDSNGTYALSYNPKITADTIIYGAGNTKVADLVYGLRFDGPTDDLTFRVISPDTGGVDSYDVTLAPVTTNLLEIQDILVTMDDGQQLHYSYVFSPYVVEYENAEYVGASASGLIWVIPLLILVAGLVMATSVIRNKE